MSRGEQARADILDAAEQLIAEAGVQVPLREIAIAAGQRNNSAVNYHFGDRRELIRAVIERRLEPMERERADMLAALAPDARHDVEALLRILVIPLTTVDSDYYSRFLQSAARYLPTDLDGTQGTVWPRVLDELASAIPTADPAAERRRITAVATAMFALLAEWERKARPEAAPADFLAEIVTMLGAMLTAPVRTSSDSTAAAAGPGAPEVPRPDRAL
ncbi:TetR family transcriptional regulator [Nocardia sp. NBC_00416]|uniref:TetR family transcriptional regulator n=1 Tax=Nocardia sp. NBC_00416 TaxID=2975991 RepID=UPI002E2466E9